MIPYGRQNVSNEDIDAVVEVLRSDYLTQGHVVPEFESRIASYCGVRHAVAMNSATSALHVACLALGVGPGDLVWTTPITFVASANCALYCGADVDFVDIDPQTFNISVNRLEEKLLIAERNGRLPKVVIPVHMAGQSCDMADIHALSAQYGFRIIEDASHAIGGTYRESKVGSCQYSDITVFSFHPVKIITTGEGGMAVTNDSALAKQMTLLRSHGITRDPSEMTRASDGVWYYQQIRLGFNYRMTDIHAALGISQMNRIDDFLVQRQVIARNYDTLLTGTQFRLPLTHTDGRSALHLYIVRFDCAGKSITQKDIFTRMRASGVGINLHYIPVYRHPHYERMGFKPDAFPESERYYAEAISLPIFPGLTFDEQIQVVDHLKTITGQVSA